jgi:hypothetical protein
VNVMSEPAARRPMVNLDEFERRLGRPAAPARNGEDPLAELARLVGGTEDRYKTVFQPRPAPPRYPAEPLSASEFRAHEPIVRPRRLGGDFAAIEAGLRGAFAPEFRAPPAPAPVAAPEPELQPEPDIDADDWLNAPYLPPPPVAEAPRSRLPLYATAAIIIFGMAGIGASFALKRHPVAPHEIAMIKADDSPTKIQASYAGDAPRPDQDASVLDNSPQPAPVAVVTHSEEPADLSAAPQASPSQPQASANQAQQVAAPAAIVPVPAPPAAEGQSFGLAGMIEPKKVRTVVVRPDGTIVANDSPDQVPEAGAAQPSQTAAAQQVPAIAPVGPGPVALDAAAARPKTTERIASSESPDTPASTSGGDGDAAEPATAPQTQSADANAANVADAGSEATDSVPQGRATNFAVQLAAPGSEAEARQSMAKLQREYGNELSGYHLKYRQATVANRSVYRVRVVGLSHQGAITLCEKLQTKGGSCFVAKN